jgi:glycosyltransferase involved in cell wall biosynthesis
MRILTLTNLYPNPFEPHRATFNRQQIRALAAMTPVHVISPIAWTDELSGRRRHIGEIPSTRRVMLDGVCIDHPRYLYTPKVLRGHYGRFYKWSVRSSVSRAIEEFSPDVIFAPWAYPDGWAAVQLGQQHGLPVVIKVHGCDVLYGLRHNPAKLPGTIQALRGADGVIAVSGDLLQRVAEFGVPRGQIQVVYDGIDAIRFHPEPRILSRQRLNLPLGKKMLLFVGGLLPVKGLDILIEACGLLRDGGLDFTCHLIGEGPMRGQLSQRIAELGLREVVTLHGSLPHEQLPDWFRSANVFVLPSRSEGVPCVLLEAAACGTSFVASNVGGIPEVAEMGHGRLVEPEDPAALARSIARELDVVNGHDPHEPVYARTHEQAASEVLTFIRSVCARRVRGQLAIPTAAHS